MSKTTLMFPKIYRKYKIFARDMFMTRDILKTNQKASRTNQK